MEFGVINLFGLVIMAIIMVPNILYAIHSRPIKNQHTNKFMDILEQVGRYGSLLLMFIPLGVWKFGFHSVGEMLAYLIGNAVLLLVYLLVWITYFKVQSKQKAIVLAVTPTLIFLLSGIMLRHTLLIVFAFIFGVGHIYVTSQNNKIEG